MRPGAILVIGFFGTVAVLTATFWIGWFAICFALLPAVLVVCGHTFLPMTQGSLRLTFDPEKYCHSESPAEETFTVTGTSVVLGSFPIFREFKIERDNYVLLALIVVCSLGTAVWLWPQRHGGMPEFAGRPWIMYYGSAGWVCVVGLAMRWIRERALLREPALALAHVAQQGKHGVYSFTDARGQFFGDTVWQLKPSRSEYEVVFFDSERPNFSLPASALLFHKLRWLS